MSLRFSIRRAWKIRSSMHFPNDSRIHRTCSHSPLLNAMYGVSHVTPKTTIVKYKRLCVSWVKTRKVTLTTQLEVGSCSIKDISIYRQREI